MRRLLIRPGAIGDCILSFPALEYLKADYTELWISSAAVPIARFADTVRPISSTGIDLVGVGDIAMSPELRETLLPFDSIVSWYGANRPAFRDAIAALGVPCQFHSALPPPEFAGHAIDFFAGQVGAPVSLVPRIKIQPANSRDSVVMHPFSGSARKNWPLASFLQLADKLPLKVEWTAGPEEDLPNATRFANLADLAAWIAGGRLYIGNDSGITHLAAAVGTETLALFGPTSPDRWAPRGRNVALLRGDPLSELPVETVLETVNQLLG
jgi:ADP-heptose:LPS heptosyltransferase